MGTGTGPYGGCRSNQCCVAVWSRWWESATRRVGFRALKKTLEAPYTTKVNNRERTTRGTTLTLDARLSLFRGSRLYPLLSFCDSSLHLHTETQTELRHDRETDRVRETRFSHTSMFELRTRAHTEACAPARRSYSIFASTVHSTSKYGKIKSK